MLTIHIDFKSPAAYLALKPTRALLARLGGAAAWRAFRSVERERPSEGADPERILTHHRVRTESRRTIFAKYAALQGVELRFPERLIETDLALGVLEEIAGDPSSYLDAAFRAHWSEQRDLDDEETVRALIAESGVAHSGDFASARSSLDRAQAEAEAAGVIDVPAYRLGGRLFIGREHLPWIEEILSAPPEGA